QSWYPSRSARRAGALPGYCRFRLPRRDRPARTGEGRSIGTAGGRAVRRRVVVTGMGMITPVGGDTESSWRALCEGQGGAGPIALCDARTFPTRIAAEVPGFRLADYRGDAARWQGHGRTSQFALAAASMAAAHAGIDGDPPDPDRFGVYVGSGEGEQDFA